LPDLKPGVSGRAEIVITNLPSVLTVPIQAVTTSRGQQVCFVQRGSIPEQAKVGVGMYNDKFIEVKSGLKEGDTVLLSALANSESIDLGGSIVQASEVDTNETTVARQIREGTFNDGGNQKSVLDGGPERKPSSSERKPSSGDRERKSSDGSSSGERPPKTPKTPKPSKPTGGT